MQSRPDVLNTQTYTQFCRWNGEPAHLTLINENLLLAFPL